MSSFGVGAYSDGLRLDELLESFEGFFQAGLNRSRESNVRFNEWVDDVVAVFATGDRDKFDDGRSIVSPFMPVFRADMFLPQTTPESPETLLDPVHIVRDKVLQSVECEFKRLLGAEKKTALQKIGAVSDQHVLVMSDDRGLFFPNEIGDHQVWDDLRQHEQLEVREAFSQSEGFPGFRLKEVTSAIGPKEFLKRAQIAARDLGVDLTHMSRFVMFFKPLKVGLLPLPDEGLIISEIDRGLVFKDLDYGDPDLVVDEYDNFAMPQGYGGKTIAELRESGSDYMREGTGAARVLQAFLNNYHVPLSNKKQKVFNIFNHVTSVKHVSNLSLGVARKRFEPNDQNIVGGHKRSKHSAAINSLANVGRSVYHGHGVLIEYPEKTGDVLLDLTKRVEGALLASHRIALKPFDQFHGSGRPLMIDERFYQENLSWVDDFYASKTFGEKPKNVLDRFTSLENLKQKYLTEDVWDPRTFKCNDAIPCFDMVTEAELKNMYGLSEGCDLGFVVSVIGSASSKIESGLSAANSYAYQCAKKGVTISSGGGTESVMGEFFKGALKARGEGYTDFLKLGLRGDIVSNKEGHISVFRDDFGLDIERDSNFRIAAHQNLCERQHGVVGPSHVCATFIGGPGTAFEIYNVMYHNLMVEMRGSGIFPGFESNNRKIELIVVNSLRPDKKPHFDVILNAFTEQQRAMMNVHVFDDEDAAFDLTKTLHQEYLKDRTFGLDSVLGLYAG